MSLRDRENSKRQLRRNVFYVVAFMIFFVGLIYATWTLRSLLLPIVVGATLAYIFKPLLKKSKVSWIPNNVKVLLILSCIVSALVLAVTNIRNSIPSKEEQLVLRVRMAYKLNEKFDSFMGIDPKTGKGNFVFNQTKDEILPILASINKAMELSPEERKKFKAYYKESEGLTPKKYYDYFIANLKRNKVNEKIMKQELEALNHPTLDQEEEKSSLILGIINTFSTWLITPFLFVFLLFDNGQILRFLISLVPNRFFELSLNITSEVDQAIGNYLRGTILECALVGLTLGFGLYLVGIGPNVAILIGVTAGLANAIPFLGPLIGLLIGLGYVLIVEEVNPILPFITLDNLIVAVLACVGLAQLLDNAVFQPVVLGGAVNLHPIVVILGVMGGSVMFGFAGMLLAIPTIVIFKVITETLFREMKAYRII